MNLRYLLTNVLSVVMKSSILDPFIGKKEMILIDGGTEFSAEPSALINTVITISVALAIIVAIILAAASGYTMMSSGGDAAKLKDAKEQLQNAILGLLVILGALTITTIVFNLLGVIGVY